MRVFIWERAKLVTWREHSEAGVVIFALNIDHARHQFMLWQREHKCHDEYSSVYLLPPDDNTPVVPRLPKVYIFPDAGCC